MRWRKGGGEEEGEEEIRGEGEEGRRRGAEKEGKKRRLRRG